MTDDAGQEGKRICGSMAFAIVPADVLEDRTLSLGARWLFAILCRHADPGGFCKRSMTKLADQEDTTTRSLQRWMSELEERGLVIKLNDRGKSGQFRVIRDPAERDDARAYNLGQVVARRGEFGEYGRRGAAVRATRDRHVAGEQAEADFDQTATRDSPVALPVTPVSPTRDSAVTSTRDSHVAQNNTRYNKTPITPPAQQKAAAAAVLDESSEIAAEVRQAITDAGGVGRWVRHRREAAGLERRDVASLVGLAVGTVRGLENGTYRPTGDRLIRIVTAMQDLGRADGQREQAGRLELQPDPNVAEVGTDCSAADAATCAPAINAPDQQHSMPLPMPSDRDRYAEMQAEAERHRQQVEARRQRTEEEDAERERLTVRAASLIQSQRGMEARPAMGKARLAMSILQDHPVIVGAVTRTSCAADTELWPLIDDALREFEG